MRNYATHPAQTHLELFIQMAAAGAYTSCDIERCNQAYHLSLGCVFPLVRGSGKPFIAHLVGTASILASQGFRAEVVIAALMHAIYQRRVPFPGAYSGDDRRSRIVAEFGPAVEKLVYDYTQYEDMALQEYAESRRPDESFRDVLAMRLADELEDLSCFALFPHGLPGDSPDVKGSYPWRREQKRTHVKTILAVSDAQGWQTLSDAFHFWIDAEPPVCWSDALKSGQYSSYQLSTPSA